MVEEVIEQAEAGGVELVVHEVEFFWAAVVWIGDSELFGIGDVLECGVEGAEVVQAVFGGARSADASMVGFVHHEEVVEVGPVLRADLACDGADGDAVFLAHRDGAVVSGIARVPVACSSRVDFEAVEDAALVSEVDEERFSEGGTADVAHTDEEHAEGLVRGGRWCFHAR